MSKSYSQVTWEAGSSHGVIWGVCRSLICVGNTFPTSGWHPIYHTSLSSSLPFLLPVKLEIPQEMWKVERRKCHMQAGFRHDHLSVLLLIRSFPRGGAVYRGWATLSGSLRRHACTMLSTSITPKAQLASLVAIRSILPSWPHCTSHYLQDALTHPSFWPHCSGCCSCHQPLSWFWDPFHACSFPVPKRPQCLLLSFPRSDPVLPSYFLELCPAPDFSLP